MDRGLVSPNWQPLVTLLQSILERASTDLAQFAPVSLSVSIGPSNALQVLASLGPGPEFIDAQAYRLGGGPLPDAVDTGLPIALENVWSDPRWPRLTRAGIAALYPGLREVWERIEGVAVMPAGHNDYSMIAMSCSLAGPADERILHLLARYRQLLESSVAIAQATSVEGPEQVLTMLQSRAIIEQAKGAIMAAHGCGPDQAWRTLREASQAHNLRLRDIATALVEQLSGAPAEHPVGLPKPTVNPEATEAAVQLWKSLF